MDPNIREISIDDILGSIHGEQQPLRFTPAEMAVAVCELVVEKKDIATYHRFLDAYIDYAAKCQIKFNDSNRFQGTLRGMQYMALTAFFADFGFEMDKLKLRPDCNRVSDVYRDESLWKETMTAFAQYAGYNGNQIASIIFKDDGPTI